MNESNPNVNAFHDWLREDIFKLVVNGMVSHDDVIEALEFELELARDRKAEEEEQWDDDLEDEDSEDEDEIEQTEVDTATDKDTADHGQHGPVEANELTMNRPITQEQLDTIWRSLAASDMDTDEGRVVAVTEYLQTIEQLNGDLVGWSKEHDNDAVNALLALLKDRGCTVLKDPAVDESQYVGYAVFWPDVQGTDQGGPT